MQSREILEKFAFFNEAEPLFQTEVLENVRYTELPAGATYVHEGNHCQQIAFVGAGQLRVFKIGETGREITLYHVFPGQTCLLNISCLMSGLPCPATAVVEAPVEAVTISGDQFRRWVNNNRLVRDFVFEILSTRVADIMALVEEVAFRKMDQRLADYLRSRFLKTNGSMRELAVTHEKIAADLGSAREVVSRLLKEFEREKAIKLARGRIILDQESVLRTLANF